MSITKVAVGTTSNKACMYCRKMTSPKKRFQCGSCGEIRVDFPFSET